jgi:hypothetical protein
MMTRRRLVDPAMIPEWWRRFQAGERLQDISVDAGVSTSALAKHLARHVPEYPALAAQRRFNGKRKAYLAPPDRNPPDPELMWRLWAVEGVSLSRIAIKYEIFGGTPAIKRALQAHPDYRKEVVRRAETQGREQLAYQRMRMRNGW